MMTGYGYNSNLVKQPPALQSVDGDWGQVANQSQFLAGSDSTGLPNPALFYGSMGGWYQPPSCNFPEGGGLTNPMGSTTMDALDSLASRGQPSSMMYPPGLAPPPPQPRMSISDEELYQALNISPLPATSTTAGYHHSHLQQQQQQQPHPQTDFLSSDICYPSTSSYASSVYETGYMPAASTIPPEDPHHYHDVDDERSFDEPGRYGAMSPTFSINSFAPTTSTNTAEAEDLEVELINNAKAPPTYHAPDDIDIFLHTGTTDDTEYHDDDDDDDDSRSTTTYSHRSTKAPSPPASRPAYAQKLTAVAQHPKGESTAYFPDAKTTPLFLQTVGQLPSGFTPLLTPNSDALLQKKLSEVVNLPPQQAPRLTTFPAFPQNPTSQFSNNQRYQDNYVDYNSVSSENFYPPTSLNPKFEFNNPTDLDIFPLLLDTFKPLPPPQFSSVAISAPANIPERLTSTSKQSSAAPTAPIKAPRLSDQELECESQKLAIDVISNLFTCKKEIVERAAVLDAPKKPVARNLFCHDEASKQKAKTDEPIKMNVLDDWETADDEDLAGRMENLLKCVKMEEKKKPVAPPTPAFASTLHKSSDWDKNYLQHVLEIYGVPDYKMQEDVVKAMETIGYGDSKVMWMERKVVFAVFESVARAKNCLTLAKHDWLRFRSLADSPKGVQDFAKTSSTSLSLPKKKQQTTATVARRMVENALGKKATVTAEKRQEERNQLAAAKAAKKNTIQWD